MIHEYFKRDFDDFIIILQLNPETYSGVELNISKDKSISKRELQFDEDIYEDLSEDKFERSSPIEFNLYLKGVAV